MTRFSHALDGLSKVLLAPVSSEKTTRSGERENSVTFWVHPSSTKQHIKKAVELFFPQVKVKSVRTSVQGRKNVTFGQRKGRTKKTKKAYVTLVEGTQIDFTELELS